MLFSYTLKWRGSVSNPAEFPQEEDLYKLSCHIARGPGETGLMRDMKLSAAKTITVWVEDTRTAGFERAVSARWGVISKSGPVSHAVPAQGVWVCSLMATHESIVRAPYPTVDGHVTVGLPALLAYYDIPSYAVNDHYPILTIGTNLVEFRVWSWCEDMVRDAIQLKLTSVYAAATARERATVMLTVPRSELERSSLDERPTLGQIEERMGLPNGVLDRNFGVVEIDDESWCVRGPGWCESKIQGSHVFSDPVIGPMGPPEPESK